MKVRILEPQKSQFYLVLFSDGTIAELTAEGTLMLMMQNFCSSSNSEKTWKDYCNDMSMYPGETFAYQSDRGELVFPDPEKFVKLIKEVNVQYISIKEYAQRYGVSSEQIKVYCQKGRIQGARRIGKLWIIPEDAPYPTDRPKKKRIMLQRTKE